MEKTRQTDIEAETKEKKAGWRTLMDGQTEGTKQTGR